MNFARFAVRGLFCSMLAVSAIGAQAAVTVQAVDATGTPGGVVLPALQYDFDAPYAVLSFGLQFSYDPSKLFFELAASEVSVDGFTVSFADAIATLPTADFVGNFGVDPVTGKAFGDFSFIPSTAFSFNQQLIFRPAFTVLGSPAAGPFTSVSFSGDLADDVTSVETVFAVDAAIAIAAVPEPATWLSFGIGMLALGATVRHTRRRNGA